MGLFFVWTAKKKKDFHVYTFFTEYINFNF